MDSEAYSERPATLHEYCFESKKKKIKQKIFQIINDSMQINSVTKTQFAGLNDHDGIVSLPFAHFLKLKLEKKKKSIKQTFMQKFEKKVWIFSIRKSCHTFV